ncbi:MAG TPA: ribosome-associated translation inhibitor RaiA [Oligoflexia bacterium]|nr:ribosome-associated translation inhibitor RaiA [Oligoflexia bacterium]HMR24865.1 ribosome-associated translation inhibitor RaiA [Oligoflexia bacterium]
MKKNITFRHMDSSDALKTHAYEKLRKLEKYNNPASEAHIVLSVDGHRHQAEINFTAKQFSSTVSAESTDMYASIDDAVTKLEQSIKKHNDKIRAQG